MSPRRPGQVRRKALAVLSRLRRSWNGRRELALFGAAYLVYFGVRALTEGGIGQAVVNARHLLAFEQSLGINGERELQRLVLDSDLLRDVANGIYMWGHWPVLIVGGLLLCRLAPRHYFRLRNVCLLSGAIGLIVFAVFPVAPPRLSGLGFVDTVTLHDATYRSILPTSLVNEYAAMPSFHAGWNLMLGIALFRASRLLLVRLFAVAMPLGMAFATIATANHFVLDVMVGAAIVVASIAIVSRLETTLGGDAPLAAVHGEPPDGPSVRRRPPGRERPRRTSPGGADRRPAHRS